MAKNFILGYYINKCSEIGNLMKKSILALIMCLTLSQANASNLVQMDMKKTSDSSVDVTLFTTDASVSPMVTKKANNTYVILMPNVSGHSASSSAFSSMKDVISNVDVKSVDDGMSGYTKVTLTTTKPLNIKAHVQKAAPVSSEEKAAKSIIAQVKVRPTVTQQAPKAQQETAKKVENVKPVQKVEKKVEKTNIVKNEKNTNQIKNTTQNTTVTTKPVEQPAEQPKVAEETVAATTVETAVKEPIKTVENAANEVEKFLKIPKASKNFGWTLLVLPILFLYMLARMVKNSVNGSNILRESFNENLSEKPYEEKNYDDIISDSDLSWQEKYKKFLQESGGEVKERKYSFIQPVKTINATDVKRIELENLLDKIPKIYEDTKIDISDDSFPEVKSEDFAIQDAMSKSVKLKAFAKPASLSTAHRANVTKLLPKYSHAKEGKFIKLFETPLNSTSRKFANANLKVSDLINTGSKYLQDKNKDVEFMEKEQNYMMSSIDEYFALLDKEQSRKVTNPNGNKNLSKKVAASLANVKPSMSMQKPVAKQVSNPIARKSKNYMDGLIVKDSYNVDENRSFHIVILDGVSALVGRINNDITVIKKFDSDVDKLQVRPDGENVYMVRAGSFKSLVDANNMGVLIEL